MQKKGFILIVVLWLVAIFSLLGASLAYRARIYMKLARYQFAVLESQQLTKAAINQAILALIDDDYSFDLSTDNWAQMQAQAAAQGEGKISITDENQKININIAPLEMLARLPRLDEVLAKEIVEKRPFLRPQEVLYVQGITALIFYGEKDIGQEGLKDLITVYSDGKININTAPAKVLECIPAMDQAALEAITNFRQGSGFKQEQTLLNDLVNLGIAKETAGSIINFLTVRSNIYKIDTSQSNNRYNIKRRITAVVQRTAASIIPISWEEQ